MPIATALTPRTAAGIVLGVASATIAGALASQHVWGLVPCKLCLLQRQPYYVAIPLAAAAFLLPGSERWRRVAIGLLAVVFAVSAGLGAYHAGVEWGWFLGPSDCAGGSGAPSADVGDFLRQLDRTRVVSCTEAAWRFAGLSLAGWNALISLALGAMCSLAGSGMLSRRAIR